MDELKFDFVEAYSRGILEELGVTVEDDERSKKLLTMVGARINARVYLEIVGMLTPEQAAAVADDMEKSAPDPEKTLRTIVGQIPGFSAKLAQVLASIRSELLTDLKALAV